MAVGIYALHRDPALWDRPLVFDPDRFSPEASKGTRPLAIRSVHRGTALVHR